MTIRSNIKQMTARQSWNLEGCENSGKLLRFHLLKIFYIMAENATFAKVSRLNFLEESFICSKFYILRYKNARFVLLDRER